MINMPQIVEGIAVFGPYGNLASGTGILWIHGYTMDHTAYEGLWNQMPEFRHYSLDLPGHGISRKFHPRETLPELGREVANIAKGLNLRHIAGVSFGGLIALQAALESPDYFASLLLNSSPVGGEAQDPAAITRNLELRRLYAEKGPGKWLGELWMQWPPDIFKGASAHPNLFGRLRDMVEAHSWAELGDISMAGIHGHRQKGVDLAKISAATLIVVGDDDIPVFKRNAEVIRRNIPNSTRVYLPGAGHLGFLELPEGSAELIRNFYLSLGIK